MSTRLLSFGHKLGNFRSPSLSLHSKSVPNSFRTFATKRQQRAAAGTSAKQNDGSGFKKKKNKKKKSAVNTVLIDPSNPKKALSDAFYGNNKDDKDILTEPITDMEQNYDGDDLVRWSLRKHIKSQQRPLLTTEEADESGVSKADPADMIDFASMYDPSIHLPDKPDFTDPRLNYEVATDLYTYLEKYIGVRGPITTAEFMRQALTHPKYGYYTQPTMNKAGDDIILQDEEEDDEFDNDWDINENEEDKTKTGAIFGLRGDFVTAPEISQIFGECLLIWLFTEWQSLGKPQRIQLVEIGPGRGTLMADVLTAAIDLQNAEFCAALARGNGVHLVEVSPVLQSRQKENLSNTVFNIVGEENEGDHEKIKKNDKWKLHFVNSDLFKEQQKIEEEEEEMSWETKARLVNEQREKEKRNTLDTSQSQESIRRNGDDDDSVIAVNWHANLSSVPKKCKDSDEFIPTFFLCQEFIDALPVHSFQKTEDGWRERLVDVDIKSDTSATTPSSPSELKRKNFVNADQDRKNAFDATADGTSRKPRLRFVLPPDATPAARTLLNIDKGGKFQGENKDNDGIQIGDIIEVCPDGMIIAQDISSRIRESSGAAIIIDYGSSQGSTDSLRAFSRHKQVHVLSHPGEVDVTADVDFLALKRAAESITNGNDIKSKYEHSLHGPISQGQFLTSMGAVERVVKLIESDDTTDEQAQDLYNALERLVLPEHMGERYKVLAISSNELDTGRQPAGFNEP